MRALSKIESNIVSGGIWCTYDGQPCSGCANLIEIDGDDCSIIKGQLSVNTGHFDTGGIVMGVAAGWSGLVVTYAAGYMFGLGAIATGGIGLVLGTAIAVGYAATR
jgi:hypothetical protein